MPRIFTSAVCATAILGAIASAGVAPNLSAQDVRITESPRVRVVSPSLIWTSSRDRAVLGVTMGADTKADTAGVRIEAVDADGPAAKAGLKSGDVITEINGVSLRVSADDAADPALQGIAQRRLQRTMAKAKPGDDISLRVRSGGTTRAVSVKTVSAADLDGQPARTGSLFSSRDDNSSAIGLSVGGSGSVRDTLGLFISSVVANGPAETAGVIEGDRIAAINGVDVRVPKEDLEDAQTTSARVNRFVREVRKVEPGQTVTLRLFSNGRYREVSVKTVKMSDLPSQGFQMSIGDGGLQIFRGGPGSAVEMLPFGAVTPRDGEARSRIRAYMNGEPLELNSESMSRSMQQLRERMEELGRDYRFRVTPRGRADGVVRIQTAPRRTTTIL